MINQCFHSPILKTLTAYTHPYAPITTGSAISRGIFIYSSTAIGLSLLAYGILTLCLPSCPGNATLGKYLIGSGGAIVVGSTGYAAIFSAKVVVENFKNTHT